MLDGTGFVSRVGWMFKGVSSRAVVKVSRICDPGPRNLTIERFGAQLSSTMHREISAGSLRGFRGPEIVAIRLLLFYTLINH